MNKCYLQRWEESGRISGVVGSGVSLHVDLYSHEYYLNSIYNSRKSESIPDEYDRVSGRVLEVYIEDELYKQLLLFKSIRLFEYELNNLMKLDEITLNQSEFF